MRLGRVSLSSRVGLLLTLASALLLAACGSGGSGNELALPVVTISPVSASVQASAQLQFTATVVTPTSTTITWAVNGFSGGNATVGTVSSTGLYTAPSIVPSPATVTVTASSSAETHPSGSAIVTITAPAVNTQVSIAPLDTVAQLGTSVQYAATVTGTDNTAVTWSVNGVAGGNSTVGSISTSGLYQAPSGVPSPATIVVTASSQVDPSQTASTTLTVLGTNTAPLYVGFGPEGDTGNPSTTYYNGLFTTISVCLPSTPDCQIIPNVIVDTSSVGLRLLNSALTIVPSTELGTVKDSAGNQIDECVQFPDTSYTWGQVYVADVEIGGETASAVPIQVMGDITSPVPYANCLTMGSGPSLDTVQALGANGILGIGTSIQDCGLNCAAGETFSGYPYYICPQNVCQTVALPVVKQVSNPIAFFPKDNNGVEITLPSIPAAGAPSLPYVNADGSGLLPTGQLAFGVGTESDNALGSATIYALDDLGNFPEVSFGGTTYDSGGSLNTGAGALFLSSPATLGISLCTDNPFYCPDSTTPVSLNITGANGSAGSVTVEVASADSLLNNGLNYSAFNDLATPTLSGLKTDQFDLGLPFFFGRSVFVGIGGTAIPNSVTAPNGYFAF